MSHDHEDKLSTLLAYWLEHNQEHGAEFREWADRIDAEQKEVAQCLRQAADKMAETDEFLKRALNFLK